MFLWFANFYRKFIQDHLKRILSLTQLIKKDQSFVWLADVDNSFLDLKKAFTSTPILVHIDLPKQIIIEADASYICSW